MSWADQVTEESGTLRAQNLGAAVCADGANGLKSISFDEARRRGLYVDTGHDPDRGDIPLVAYHPGDWGSPRSWAPSGRDPIGLDAPENMTGPRVLQLTGPGAGSYLTKTALVNPGYGERDARRYFDSSAVPGWVIPRGAFAGTDVGLGDLAELNYEGRTVWAQAYDVGPADSAKLEISVEACTQLGIPNCARRGGAPDGLSITILPGSRRLTAEGGKVRPWTVDNVARISEMAEAYTGQAAE